MLGILNKSSQTNPEQATWFAQTITRVIYHDMRAKREYIHIIKAFYNVEVNSCIVRISFNKKYDLGLESEFLYFKLEFGNQKMTDAGVRLENAISDKDNSITWIHNNEVLVFYPDNNIMDLLTKKMHTLEE